MQLAMESPVPNLDEIRRVTDFDFVLCHLLDNPRYRQFFAVSGRNKILDNSANELAEPISLDRLLRAAEDISATLFIPPDFHNDAARTLASAQEALKVVSASRICATIHGTSVEECILLARTYAHLGIRRIAVPCDVTLSNEFPLSALSSTRCAVVSSILPAEPTLRVHLLGISLPEELLNYGRFRNVVSVDTGSPVLNALHGRQYGGNDLVPKGVPFSFLDEIPSVSRELLWYNIAYLRKCMSGSLVTNRG